MLSARIDQDARGEASFRFDAARDFEVRVERKTSDTEWFELAWEEQKRPFDMGAGPLVKFVLLRSDDSADLVAICHHIICDGLSIAYLLRDIARFLKAPPTSVDPLPAPPSISNENFVIKAAPGFFLQAVIGYLNRAWAPAKTLFDEGQYRQLYEAYWKARDVRGVHISLSKDATAALVARCRAERTTVNSALAAAFALAQYDLQGRRDPYLRKALVAINIRQWFVEPPGENFGFLAAGAEVVLPANAGDFWEFSRACNTAIKKRLTPKKVLEAMATLNYIAPSLLDAIYFAAYGAFQNKTVDRLKGLVLTRDGKPRRSLDVTNIGVFDVEDSEDFAGLYFVPILSPNYEKAIGIATSCGQLNINLLHDCAQISASNVEDFKRRAMEYIEASVAGRR